MARKKKSPIEAEFDRCYGIHGNGVQINIMDMSKLYKEATEPKEGETIEQATIKAIAHYRKN